MRTALGADYEAQLRSAAGPQPDKMARRKHQISSLFHQAKMKVLVLHASINNANFLATYVVDQGKSLIRGYWALLELISSHEVVVPPVLLDSIKG